MKRFKLFPIDFFLRNPMLPERSYLIFCCCYCCCMFKRNTKFMKKIPRNCKVANALVGEMDSLSEEIVALIRLQHPFVVGQFTEVSLSTKYIFILLGPKGNMTKYLEIAKCMCTLFADEVSIQVIKISHEIYFLFHL